MGEVHGLLQQAPSNVVANGMSSAEEAKYRYWDEDPSLLLPPRVVAEQAASQRQRQVEMTVIGQRELGFVAVSPMMLE